MFKVSKQAEVAELESTKSSTREKAAFTETIVLSPTDLEVIKDQAHKLYLAHADGSTVRAHVQATLNHLVKLGFIK
jgi:hypothetical protein